METNKKNHLIIFYISMVVTRYTSTLWLALLTWQQRKLFLASYFKHSRIHQNHVLIFVADKIREAINFYWHFNKKFLLYTPCVLGCSFLISIKLITYQKKKKVIPGQINDTYVAKKKNLRKPIFILARVSIFDAGAYLGIRFV